MFKHSKDLAIPVPTEVVSINSFGMYSDYNYKNDITSCDESLDMLTRLNDQQLINKFTVTLLKNSGLSVNEYPVKIEVEKLDQELKVSVYSIVGLEQVLRSNRNGVSVAERSKNNFNSLAVSVSSVLHHFNYMTFMRNTTLTLETPDGNEYFVDLNIYDKESNPIRNVKSRVYKEDILLHFGGEPNANI